MEGDLAEAVTRGKPEGHHFGLTSPVVLELTHDELSHDEMFRLAFILDGFELQRDRSDSTRRIKATLIFDVVEMEPTRTRVRVTPRRSVTHDELRDYVSQLLSVVDGTLGRPLRLERLTWEAKDYGIPSDERTTLRRI